MFSLRFIPDMMPKLTVEKVTEEDFNLLKDNLIKPFGQLLKAQKVLQLLQDYLADLVKE